MFVIIVADVWKTAPFMALLILAGLQTIPGEIYEAAKVDGATTWQRFIKITLPLLMPAILVALIFRTLDALRIFDLPYVLDQGRERHDHAVDASPSRRSPRTGSTASARRSSVLTFITVMIVSFTLHPVRGRQHPRPGGGLDHGSRITAAAARPAGGERRSQEVPDGGPRTPWWMWLAVAAIVRLLPVSVLLAGQPVAEDR